MMILTTLSLLAFGGVTVELPATSTSKGLDISVAEVATVTGDDPEEVERVRAASLGYAPAPGYHRTLRADLLRSTIRQAVPGVEVTFKGAPRCRVTAAVVTIPGIDLQAEAAAALRATLVGFDAEAKVTGALADLHVPASTSAPRIVVPLITGRPFPGVRSIPVQVWLDGRIYRTVTVTFNVSIWKRQAVLRRAINTGDALHAGLFRTKRVAVDGAQGMFALDQMSIAGAVALKPLAAGVAVTENDVHRQVIVRRGDTVTVRVSKGTVVVSDVGVAQSDGRMGERVDVELRSTGRVLSAAVRGIKTVEVKIQ